MAARQRDGARRAYGKILDLLGRHCVWCGATESEEKLTLDCIEPMPDHHAEKEWSWRVSFYRAQLAADNLQVLCDRCNSRKGEAVIDFRPAPELNWEHCGEFRPF